jgi:hypothetical protein
LETNVLYKIEGVQKQDLEESISSHKGEGNRKLKETTY